jgi:hypothetical protein
MGPFVSEGWRLIHLHGETIQRRVLFRDALMKILALKVSEVRRQQPAIALDIPLMAQDFLGSHIDRHPSSPLQRRSQGSFRLVVARVCPAEPDTIYELRVKTGSWSGGRADWRRHRREARSVARRRAIAAVRRAFSPSHDRICRGLVGYGRAWGSRRGPNCRWECLLRHASCAPPRSTHYVAKEPAAGRTKPLGRAARAE